MVLQSEDLRYARLCEGNQNVTRKRGRTGSEETWDLLKTTEGQRHPVKLFDGTEVVLYFDCQNFALFSDSNGLAACSCPFSRWRRALCVMKPMLSGNTPMVMFAP